MKKVEVNVYSFDELSEDVQEKVIGALWDINVDYDWWEYTYDFFKEVFAYIGVDVDLKKTYFEGFSHQGQGATVTASVDVPALIKGLKTEAWKQDFPTTEIDLSLPPVDSRIMRMVENEVINIYISITAGSRVSYGSSYSFDFDFDGDYISDLSNVIRETEMFEELASDLRDELNDFLFNQLRNKYEYLTSEEAIKETIEANGYEFTDDGSIF